MADVAEAWVQGRVDLAQIKARVKVRCPAVLGHHVLVEEERRIIRQHQLRVRRKCLMPS